MKFLPKPATFLGYICGISAAMFWGFHTLIIRYLSADGVPALGIAAVRAFIASFLLSVVFALVSIFKKQSPFEKIPYGKFFWLAVCGLAINFFLFHVGLKFTIASDAILLESLSPVIVLLLIIFFLPERVSHLQKEGSMLRKILFIFLAGAVGTSLLLINDPRDLLIRHDLKLRGDLLEFSAMFFFALFMLGSHEFQNRNQHISPIKITSHFFFFTGLFLAPFVPWNFLSALTATQWIWILVLSIFSTSASYLLWQTATKYLNILPLVILFSLSSVFTVLIESLVFQLELSFKLVLGAILVLSASIATQIISERKKLLRTSEKSSLADTA